ncbi:hypothetical protein [Paractinoplanes globisporus]|uniref:Uncharacterized protein n=1 Tax=Paractinoplanes globisporus TaxID=113565 RepID=A0ABW6WRA6_9ACTN|nr:hypothetical protein [Actinoplanes globisporus]
MTSQEPGNPQIDERDNPATEVVIAGPPPAPVFVDSTGRRSRLLRRVAYGFGGLVLLYGGLIAVSLAGGPVRSSAVLPLPGLEPATTGGAPARPSPTPAPTPSHPATPLFVAGVLPSRHTSAAGADAAPQLESARITSAAVARPTVTSAAVATATKKPTTAPTTPKVTPTTTHPVESTTVPVTTPTTVPPTTPPVVAPPAPVPPAPPATSGSDAGGKGGGQGGGSGSTSTEADPAPTVTASAAASEAAA